MLKCAFNAQLEDNTVKYQTELAYPRPADKRNKAFRIMQRSEMLLVLQIGAKSLSTDLKKATVFTDFFPFLICLHFTHVFFEESDPIFMKLRNVRAALSKQQEC